MKNLVILIGRLGKDPESRTFENGTKVSSFTLATSEKYKDRNGDQKEETQWHNIQAWKNAANFAENYLKKGDLIYLEGTLKYRSWEKDGEKKYITEVHTFNIQSLGKSQESGDIPF